MYISRHLKSCMLVFVCVQVSLLAAQTPIIDRNVRFHPVSVESNRGLVVAQESIAASVGADVLAKGGNAVDAAVATGFALAVTFPQAGNIGGGGFMLVHLAATGETLALDYREMAPAGSTADMFLDDQGRPDSHLSRSSALSSGVPGTVAGLLEAHERWGLLSRQQVLQPAIDLAAQGVAVSDSLSWSLAQSTRWLAAHPASAAYFLPQGAAPAPGELLVQADLASTLTRIAQDGKSGFYSGETAQMLVDEVERNGGIISLADLASYQVVLREPISGSYGDYQILSMPPPSSGGVHLLQILGVLDRLDIGQFEPNSAQYLHRFVEASKYAYADRSRFLGDPDFVDVPLAQLLADEYLNYLAAQIQPEHATPSSQILPGAALPDESTETTHFSVWDSQGNVVSNTYTLNFSYGNGIAVEGAGFLLNNEMDDFAAATGVANAYGLVGGDANSVEPLKRPLSSMSPSIVFYQGEPYLVTGSPGGSAIITIVAQVLLNSLEYGMNPAQAAAMPRVHHQWLPDSIRWEQGISADTRALMQSWGHIFDEQPRVWGKAETIQLEGRRLLGASDPRWPDSGVAAP